MSWEDDYTKRLKEEAKAKREARRETKHPKKEPNPAAAAKAGGKKHTITARQVGKFVGVQVFDALLAATVATVLFKTTAITGTMGLVIGCAAFGLKKLINAGVRYGKKHWIKNRKKPAKASSGLKKKLPRPVAGAITAAGTVLPLLLISNPVAIPIMGVSALTLAKLTGLIGSRKIKNIKEENEYDRTR